MPTTYVNVVFRGNAKNLQGVTNDVDKSVKSLAKNISNEMTGAFLKLAGANAIRKMLENMMDFSKEIRVSSAQLGTSIRQTQQLRTIARHANKDLTNFEAVFRFLGAFASKSLSESGGLNPLSKEGQIAKKYGITASDLTGPKSLSNFKLMQKLVSSGMTKDVTQFQQDMKSVFGPKNTLWLSTQMKDLANPDAMAGIGVAEQSDIDALADLKDAYMDLADLIRSMLIPLFVDLGNWIKDLFVGSGVIEGLSFLLGKGRNVKALPNVTVGAYGNSPGFTFTAAERHKAALDMMKILEGSNMKDTPINNLKRWSDKFAGSGWGDETVPANPRMQGIFADFQGTSHQDFNKYLQGLIKPVEDATTKAFTTSAVWSPEAWKKRIADRQASRAKADLEREAGHPDRTAAIHKLSGLPKLGELQTNSPLLSIGGLLGLDLGYRMQRIGERTNELLLMIYGAVSDKEIDDTQIDVQTDQQ